MADNITFGTDDVSSVIYPRVKLMLGADGSATADADGTAARGQYVDPRCLLARKQVTPTVSTSAYTAGDAVGGLLTFANAVRASGGTCYLESAVLHDKAKQAAAAYELWLFDRTFTSTADNAAFDPSDADLLNCLGVIKFNSADGTLTSTTATIYTWPQTVATREFPLVLNGTDLFGQLVTRGTPTLGSTTDIVVTLTLRQN